MSCVTTETYQVGDVVTCRATFRTAAGVLVNPTTVTFKIKNPNGDVTTYIYGTDVELTRPSTGVFEVYYDATVDGEHVFRYSSTGTGKAAGEMTFEVEDSAFS